MQLEATALQSLSGSRKIGITRVFIGILSKFRTDMEWTAEYLYFWSLERLLWRGQTINKQKLWPLLWRPKTQKTKQNSSSQDHPVDVVVRYCPKASPCHARLPPGITRDDACPHCQQWAELNNQAQTKRPDWNYLKGGEYFPISTEYI